MKRAHQFGPSLSKEIVREHPDDRFYSWTQELANSMMAGSAEVDKTGSPFVEVLTTESYAAKVELGGPNSRAFPFMGPALMTTQQAGISIMVAASKRALG